MNAKSRAGESDRHEMRSMTSVESVISAADLETLEWATQHLEHPSLAARLSSMVGTPIDIAVDLMPRPLYRRMRAVADAAIGKAFCYQFLATGVFRGDRFAVYQFCGEFKRLIHDRHPQWPTLANQMLPTLSA